MTVIAAGPLLVGATFHGRYEIVRVIKSGGMGTVYEALDRVTRRSRAIKTMLPDLLADTDLRARFHLEATIAAEIESSHIVEVFDAGIDERSNLPYLVMELLKGQDLGSLLEQRGRFDPVDVVAYLWQMALALDKTHAAGIVHRDLKPENLFLTARDDGGAHIKILDFGIAKVLSQSGSLKTTRNVGTPLYMSPEQIRGDASIGTASDRYACGHIAFTLLVGDSYWAPEAATLNGAASFLVRVLQGPPERASVRARAKGMELLDAFDPWFTRAIAADPAERFESTREMVEALALALGVRRSNYGGQYPDSQLQRSHPEVADGEHASTGSAAVSGLAATSTPSRRRSLGVVAVATVLLLLVGSVVLRSLRRATPSNPAPPGALSVSTSGSVYRDPHSAAELVEPAPPASVPVTAAPKLPLVSPGARVVRPPASTAPAGAKRSTPTPTSVVDPTDIR